MQVLPTRIEKKSEQYQENVAAHLGLIEKLNKSLAKAKAGGGEKYVQRHVDRGKLLPRDRINLLLDRDSPFLELLPLAGMHVGGTVPGGSVVTGIGYVNGTQCMVSASEATVQGRNRPCWR